MQHRLAMTMADDRQVDFGTFLRLAREQRGVSLQQLAVTTNISAPVLEALERNDPGTLPGGIFPRASVRAYAREVGLNADVALANFVSDFPSESGADEIPVLASIDLDRIFSNGYSFLIELLFLCQARGWRIGEVPIIYEDRLTGKSKISRAEIYKAVYTVLRLTLAALPDIQKKIMAPFNPSLVITGRKHPMIGANFDWNGV